MALRMILSITFMVFLAACALPRNVVITVPDEQGQTGRVTVANAAGNVELAKALAAVGLQPGETPGQPFTTDQQAIRMVFEKVLAATPRKPAVFVIYFEPASTQVAAISRDDLARAIQVAGTTIHPEITVGIHTDPTLPSDREEGLMSLRARSIAETMVRAGVSPGIIEITNFGPVLPLPPQPETSAPRSTRVEVTIR